jgi:hypothetical protein
MNGIRPLPPIPPIVLVLVLVLVASSLCWRGKLTSTKDDDEHD